uniref:Uncharacterized protein n=1 Tax=Timema monikensis TaxID=170555 RepID=A0A7R9EEX7_9NEOP|nr:unnamed protein product [Timema monikensis]
MCVHICLRAHARHDRPTGAFTTWQVPVYRLSCFDTNASSNSTFENNTINNLCLIVRPLRLSSTLAQTASTTPLHCLYYSTGARTFAKCDNPFALVFETTWCDQLVVAIKPWCATCSLSLPTSHHDTRCRDLPTDLFPTRTTHETGVIITGLLLARHNPATPRPKPNDGDNKLITTGGGTEHSGTAWQWTPPDRSITLPREYGGCNNETMLLSLVVVTTCARAL